MTPTQTISRDSEIKKRVTSQERVILDYLKSVKIHPAAEIIYTEVKKQLPQISLGTVYRNLNKLKEEGAILEIPTKMARYDGDTSAHSHFICDICEEIYDIFDPEVNKICFIEKMKEENSKIFKFGKVRNYQLYFYGACKKCEK